MWHFVADTHLDHGNIIKYCKRPFLTPTEQGLMEMIDKGLVPQRELRISQESVKLMTDTILDSINATVQRDDTLVIVGDFCWTTRENRERRTKELRDRINCRNIYLIWGNHDDRPTLQPKDTTEDRATNSTITRLYHDKQLFKGCFDQYVFKVDGQYIFTSHYPGRSWDMAHHGSWMLYGHVHNNLWHEDNGQLSPYTKSVLTGEFGDILKRHGLENAQLIDDLLAAVADQNGMSLTVDVGVDNVRPGVPFGTPWSMTELTSYMATKKARWDARQARLRALVPASSLKGNDPKF